MTRSHARKSGSAVETVLPRGKTRRRVCLVALSVVVATGVQAETQVSEYKKLSLSELMDLEVTSVSRHAEKLSETASAIQVITGEDIRRSGASSLPEALRLASNLAVAQINASNWAISARGFNSSISDKLLVLIDGRSVYTPLYAGVFWDVQDVLLEDVDRIEVISGPGGTQWGANAVNGVINITTKSSRDTQGLLLTGGGGSELRSFTGFRQGGKLTPNLHYRIYGKYTDHDSSLLSSGADAGDDWHVSRGGVRLDWDASEQNLLTLQGDIYDGGIGQTGTADTEVGGGNLLGRWTHAASPDSDFQLQCYYDVTHRDIPNSIAEDLHTYDLDFQHSFRVSDTHALVWGFGFRLYDDHIDNPATLAFLPADVRHEIYSGFIQDEITLVPGRLTLSLGSKIEHNDYTGWEYQPSARLAWRMAPARTVWAAVSRAVRTPSRIDRDFYAPATPPFSVLQGGPGFESEELIAYELGLRMQPAERLSLALATFYNDYDDLRSVEQVSPPAATPVIIGNGLRGRSYGAELTADWHVTEDWRLRAGYTRLHVSLRPKPGSTDTGVGLSEANDANDQVILRSSLDLPHDIQFDLGLRHVGRLSNQDVPAYQELELRLAWRPSDRMEISVVGQNLLDASHSEFGSAASRREIERSVYVKFQWHH